MRLLTLSLLLLALTFSQSEVVRVPLQSASSIQDSSQTRFLSSYSKQQLGSYNNNPFLIIINYGNLAYYYFGLALYRSDVILSNNCGAFYNSFTCYSSYYCTQQGSAGAIDSIFFNASQSYSLSFGYYFTFGQNSWTSSYSSFKYVSSCSGPTLLNAYYYMDGLIGLGVGSTGYQSNNFASSSFVINLESSTSGELVFGTDYNLLQGTQYGYPTDGDWKGEYIEIQLGTTYSAYGVTNFIIDLNTPYILVPWAAYKSFVSYLYTYYGFYCQSGSHDSNGMASECYFTSSSYTIKTLPLFYVYPSSGATFSLPASAYTTNLNNGYYYLNIVPTTPLNWSTTGYAYVTPNNTNTVILGQPFLLYYNALFSFSSSSSPYIYLYRKPTATTSVSSADITWIVIGGCVFLVILIAVSVSCCKKKNNRTAQNVQKAPLIPPVQYQQDPYAYQPNTAYYNQAQPVYQPYPNQTYPSQPYQAPNFNGYQVVPPQNVGVQPGLEFNGQPVAYGQVAGYGQVEQPKPFPF